MNNTNARSLVQGLIGDFSSRLPIIFFFLDQEKEGKERRVRNGIVRRLYFLGRMWFRGDAELVVTRVLEFDWIRLRA